MVEVNVRNKGVTSVISSKVVAEVLRQMADVIFISDISEVVAEKDIMLFDCKLENLTFKLSYFDGMVYEELDLDEEDYPMLMEDIGDYLSDMLEDVENELKVMYDIDEIRLRHEIYDLNESFSDVKFVTAVSFYKLPKRQLEETAKRIAKRQLMGLSKFFH